MAGSRAPAVTQAPKRRAWAGSGALGLGWVSGVLRSWPARATRLRPRCWVVGRFLV